MDKLAHVLERVGEVEDRHMIIDNEDMNGGPGSSKVDPPCDLWKGTGGKPALTSHGFLKKHEL